MDGSWTKITHSLLEKHHIRIPIQKRFFLHFVDEDDKNIQKEKIIDVITSSGFLKDDPRLMVFRQRLKALVKSKQINYEEFSYCIDNHISLLKKIFQKELIIPDFKKFCEKIKEIYEITKLKEGGSVADYIPQLKQQDPSKYGISLCTIDGQRFNIGDTKYKFSIQSCCKTINYGIALEEHNPEYVHTYVGREPSGQSFNEITLNKEGKPHNPLINAGAIMTTSLIQQDKTHSERYDHIMNIWKELSGNIGEVGFNNSVYLSEKNTADRNFAIAYFMKETNSSKQIGFPKHTNLNETLDLYFQCCSIELNTETMSIVAGTLANGGINPITGKRIFKEETVKQMLSMMLMCGMYDYSGEFAFKIGIPAKSGVAGAIMLIIPNVMGIVTFSPKLDSIGNSYRGIEFCKCLGDIFNFHIFDSLQSETKINPLYSIYQNNMIHKQNELYEACKNSDLEYVKILFQRNVDFNITDYDKRSPLHIAVCENNKELVHYLINVVKVNKHVKDRWGHTPLDEAGENKELLELLK